MAITSKLTVWNAALRELGAESLADTTTASTVQYHLNGAWDHAIELTLALLDWGFARRRFAVTGTADTAFPPFTYRMAKPSDYLRKCWIKNLADDDDQIDHAEIAAVFYAFQNTGLLEYISDHADNYDPANWPPHFTRVLTLHLAELVAPKLARAGSGDLGMLDGKKQAALADAERFESVFITNVAIATNRKPVMRRALELMGQSLSGSVAIHDQGDKLRWAMNRAWTHSVQYVLEQGAWNFATRRATLTGGDQVIPGDVVSGVTEGYSVAPATEDAETVDRTGYDYVYALPDDFLHKIWVKPDVSATFECKHQFIGEYLCTNYTPVILEYISDDAEAVDPGNWSANFLEVVAAYLALTVAPELYVEQGKKGGVRVDASQVRQKLEMVYKQKLADAKLRDAIQQFPQELPPGRFVQARLGGSPRFRVV